MVFIIFPLFNTGDMYYDNYSDYIDILSEICLSNEITLLDYSHSEIARDKNLFYNIGHLNKKGAELLSSLISTDLKSVITNVY